MQSKKCAKCGVVFTCHTPQPGCWCEKIQLSAAILDQLKNEYNDCLCPICLKGFEQVESVESLLFSYNTLETLREPESTTIID